MDVFLALLLFASVHQTKLPPIETLPAQIKSITIEPQVQPIPTPPKKQVVQAVKKKVVKQVARPAASTPKKVAVTAKHPSAKGLQCVAYARQISSIKIKGNANTWVSTARRQGYTISSNPVVGSVLSEPHLSAAGHVSVVIAKTATTVTVKEANYEAGHITTRVVPITGRQQFILPK